MPDEQRAAPHREAPEGAIGGEGAPFDQTVLAPTTDGEIEQAVRTALSLDPDVEAERYQVAVEDGVAHVSGRPRSPEERRRTLEVAGLVHGVRRVVDRSAE